MRAWVVEEKLSQMSIRTITGILHLMEYVRSGEHKLLSGLYFFIGFHIKSHKFRVQRRFM